MEPVLLAVTEIVSLLPPSRVQSIADRIRVSTPEVAGRTLHQLVSTPAARAALDDLVSSWKTSAISGEHLSGLLIGAAHLRRHTLREGNVELVWTGPQTPFVPTRRTEQVLLDLINRAKTDIFLVSFVAFDFPTVVDALNAAISRGVDVKVLLESSVSHGGSLSVDPVATMRKHVPEQRHVQVPRRPVTGPAARHDMAVAIGRAAGRRGQVAVENGELHEPVEEPQ